MELSLNNKTNADLVILFLPVIYLYVSNRDVTERMKVIDMKDDDEATMERDAAGQQHEASIVIDRNACNKELTLKWSDVSVYMPQKKKNKLGAEPAKRILQKGNTCF